MIKPNHNVRATIAAIFFTITCGIGISAHGATVTVLVGSGGLNFNPKNASINVNDTIQWSWSATGHSSTSDTPLWDSGTISSGSTFNRQFTSSGTFPYHCTPHQSFGMTGSIIVAAAANNPPSVTITNPASGKVFSAPANITIRASASDSDGTVTNVQFRQGITVLSNMTIAPYAITASNLVQGSYSFSAVATDNGGLSTTNSISVSVVNPVAVSLSAPSKSPTTNFTFNYTANSGLSYVIQRSTNLNLSQWIALVTNVATNSVMPYKDTAPSNNPAFYRVGRLPNP
jgi:plastocyanin